MVSILFVCLGNICRSPAAQGILSHMISKEKSLVSRVESCGLGDWHVGQLPDERMREAAELRGVILASRAQQFHHNFFEEFDYILAADFEVLHDLQRHAVKPEYKAKIHLITAFSKMYKNEKVPDPYYGGHADFDLVLDMLEDSCIGLLEHIKETQTN
jgi:protein-tyrosine phosphatase